jgi:hypothetical protein
MQGRLSAVAAAPPPLPQRPSALASDRKLLLQYVLEVRAQAQRRTRAARRR